MKESQQQHGNARAGGAGTESWVGEAGGKFSYNKYRRIWELLQSTINQNFAVSSTQIPIVWTIKKKKEKKKNINVVKLGKGFREQHKHLKHTVVS